MATFAPPIHRPPFLYSTTLHADGGSSNHHPRASSAELSALLRPATGAAPPKDPVWHWYAAQLLHYGLPYSKDKNVAKVRLLEALNRGVLEVPESVKRVESEMKKEWEKEGKKLKKGAGGGAVTKGKEGDAGGKVVASAKGVSVSVNVSIGGLDVVATTTKTTPAAKRKRAPDDKGPVRASPAAPKAKPTPKAASKTAAKPEAKMTSKKTTSKVTTTKTTTTTTVSKVTTSKTTASSSAPKAAKPKASTIKQDPPTATTPSAKKPRAKKEKPAEPPTATSPSPTPKSKSKPKSAPRMKTEPQPHTAMDYVPAPLPLSGTYNLTTISTSLTVPLLISLSPHTSTLWGTLTLPEPYPALQILLQIPSTHNTPDIPTSVGWRCRNLDTGALRFGKGCFGEIAFEESGGRMWVKGVLRGLPGVGEVLLEGVRGDGGEMLGEYKGEWDSFIGEAYGR